MKTILLDYRSFKPNENELSICLGYFDGVHLGHQKLIKEARKIAKYPLGLLTFDNSVSFFLDNEKSKRVLTSLDDRFRIISKFGVDYYYVLHIDKEFLALSSLDFITFLEEMNVKEVFVGSDYLFGKNRSGNIDLLKEHFLTHVVDLAVDNDKKISTQQIVSYLENGDIKNANRLMGHSYLMSGSIEKGKGIGRTIGFPTMNLKPITNYVFPRFGVYKTIAYINHLPYLSITNVGINPTVGGKDVTIEIHIPNFSKNVYNETIELEFLDFIRPEIKFSSLEELKTQIESDVKKIL